jgi:hypothetical protein
VDVCCTRKVVGGFRMMSLLVLHQQQVCGDVRIDHTAGFAINVPPLEQGHAEAEHNAGNQLTVCGLAVQNARAEDAADEVG